MFANFITALQGGPANDSDDEGRESPGAPAAPATDWAASLSGLASGLAETVKTRTNEIAQSVTTTDWASEINAFTTEVKRDAETVGKEAAHAVEHLPDAAKGAKASTETAGPSKSKLDFEEVSSGFSMFGKSLLVGTSEIFAEVTKTVTSEIDKASKVKRQARGRSQRTAISSVNGKYSRLETEVSTMQRDSSTYCDEPQDAEDYQAFLETFVLVDKKGDIEELLKTNTFMSELQSRIVPVIVEYDVFWNRYFYRLAKLQEKHEKRQAVAQRAQIPHETEEDIGWGDEDEDESATRREADEGVKQAITAVAELAVEETPTSPAASPVSHQSAGPVDHQVPSIESDDVVKRQPVSSPQRPAAEVPPPQEEPSVKVPDPCDPSPSNSSETASGEWRIVHSPTESAPVAAGAHSGVQTMEAAASADEDSGWDDFDDDDNSGTEEAAQAMAVPQPTANDNVDEEDDIDEDWGSSA